MTLRRRDVLRFACGTLPLAAALPPAGAQPAKVTRLIVGSAPGGPSDVQGRGLAEALRQAGAGMVIVDNRPGAAGRIAVQGMKGLPPDGATLLLAPGWLLTLAPLTDKTPRYAPETDLFPIGGICTQEFALVIGRGVPAATLAEYLALARTDPQRAQCASAGVGSMGHLVASMLERSAGMTFQPIPYKGAAPALQDVQAGHVACYVGALGDMVRMHKEGLARVLATSGHQRSKFLPDVPTFEQAGFRGVHAVDWTAVFAAAGHGAIHPAARFIRPLASATKDKDFSALLEKVGVEPGYFDGTEVTRRMKADTEAMRGLVKAFNLRAVT